LDEPSSIFQWPRDWFVRLWVTKGGGFYGLGYVITFVWLEIRATSGGIGGGDIGDFITAQIIQYIIRFSLDSLLNALFALIWPIYLLQWANGLGIVVLIGVYTAYRFAVHPFLENRIPELEAAREAKAARDRGGETGS
jgi:hypothetical protein